MGSGEVNIALLEKLVAGVKPSGGSEMSNYQLFVERLTGALGLPQPEFAREETRFNDYVFERNMTFGKPGGTTPSPHKSADQEAAEEELLVRLVALNQARAAEEAQGIVHWLRPEFQKPRLAAKVKGETQIEAELGETSVVEAMKWPADGLDQIRSVRDLLAKAASPIAVPALAAAFSGRNTPKRRKRVEQVLETLVSTGAARRDEATNGYYLPR